ncbi:hypothetical protein [Flavobacterium sp.]|uniref:hypothetical protein n=1 Tax=Flavobacterium sp. TaxID=239 RepID=UPI00260CDDA0|nr:hypothetical protein [Flavobacterium sp.]
MKLLLTIGFLSSFLFGFSQENQQENLKVNDSIFWGETTCKKGIEIAKKDFENGVYNAYSYGFMATITPKSEIGFDDFYKDYLRKKYSINLEHKGCVVTDYSDCYSDTMKKLIFKKFGTDIFERSRREAKKVFLKK